MDDDPKTEPIPTKRSKSDPAILDGDVMGPPDLEPCSSPLSSSPPDNVIFDTPTLSATEPRLSRNPSFSGSMSSQHDDWDLPPLDRLSVLDLLDNLALPQQLEKLQKGISAQTDKVRRSRDAFKTKTQLARERMVEEWRRRVPSADERFDRYRRRMRQRVEKLGKQWNNTKAVSLREKISFICGVMNIFISGYLMGGFPEYFHIWYTAQLVYFMPIRIFTYHRRGMHYFLADLCYFVNLLLSLSIWVFPQSKRLFTAAYCLAYGNNAVAIIMWRNSLVFHSFDKVTSLFIHIMPCATLHCIVHLIPNQLQMSRFPAIWTIKTSPPGSPTAYANVLSMLAWSSIPYAIWQLSYYFFITVRRREKIAAGRPTSFTWLRRSYSKTWIGKFVLSLPIPLQEPAFMSIQYCYAVTTMLPCSIWFYSRYASSAFLIVVFAWSIWNGSTYYIDVFGKRFQKELEAMKAEVIRWQKDPELMLQSPLITPHPDNLLAPTAGLQVPPLDAAGQDAFKSEAEREKAMLSGIQKPGMGRSTSLDRIPLLDDHTATATALDEGSKDIARERKSGQDINA